MALIDRVVKAFSAGIFSQSVNVVIQILSVPIFLAYWGKDLYGEWLLLSALPALLAASDLGINTAGANKVGMYLGAGDEQGAARIWRSAFACIAALAVIGIGLASLVVWSTPDDGWGLTPNIGTQDSRLLVNVLVLYVALGILMAAFVGALRVGNHNSLSILIDTGVRAIEFAVVVECVMSGRGPIVAGVAYVAVRLIALSGVIVIARMRLPWLRIGFALDNTQETWDLVRKGVSFLAFPIGNALMNQGPLLILGYFTDAATIVVFSTHRTLSRLSLQLVAAINASVWPELTRAAGAHDSGAIRVIHLRAVQAGIVVGLLTCIILLLAGGSIFRLWIGGELSLNWPVLNVLILGMVISAFWLANSVVPAALNRHEGIALGFLTAVGLALAVALVFAGPYGILGVTCATVIVEAVMAISVIRATLKVTGESLAEFSRRIFMV